ncbi:MAG: protein translocase subunit SecF [Melioribacteraceae bacterium]|nr:MAG: protein translocase subunit SecF [Melioribacteraceae bacterium]
MRIFENTNFDFLGKRKIAYIVSGVLLVFGLLSLLFKGIEFGIDFKGGTEIALEFEKPIEVGDARDYLGGLGLGNIEVKTFGGETGLLIRSELQEIPADLFPSVLERVETLISKNFPDLTYQITDTTSSSVTYSISDPLLVGPLTDKLTNSGFQAIRFNQEENNSKLIVRVGIADWIQENLLEYMPDNKFKVLKEDNVGPKVGGELKRDATIAVLLALVVMLIYLGFRFKFVFALGAVAALFHDVLITLGIFSILYNVIPGLNLEISVNVVAAFLTLVGYSINDTVIVFDRIRENIKIHKTAPLEDNINKAINKTIPRTIITSLTTLIVVAVLLFFGGEVLRGFAFTLFFGVVIGTYSSIFVASPFVLEYASKVKKNIQF